MVHDANVKLDMIAYSPDRARVISPARFKDLPGLEAEFDVIWVNVIGIEDTGLVLRLGELFNLHMLSLEDVINVHQRAKCELFENYTYCVVRMLRDRFESEQLSIFHTGKTVITIQEQQGDCLGPLRGRIEKGGGQVRNKSSDYLVYAIIDSVLDHYFPIVEEYSDLLESIDELLIDDRSQVSLHEIHRLRRGLTELRRWLKPHREMVNQMLRGGDARMQPETLVYLRDCYDHVIQLNEAIDVCLETCSGLRDFHFNAVSNKTNEIMKTLTIISTIFIPLSFLAGVYGMNFQFMPGLGWKYGFGMLTLAMLGIGGGMLAWFRRRGWFV